MSDKLLARVHQRIGGLGLDIATFGATGSVEIRWRRDYGEEDCGTSDERYISAPSLALGLQEVLKYEDWADRFDAEEEALIS